MQRLMLAGVLAIVPVSVSATELITNGGFEDPNITHPCCNTVPPDALPGWSINSGNVNVVNGTFSSSTGDNLAFEGTQYLDLVGQGGVGSISQAFTTIAGQLYTLNFVYSHNLFGGSPSASAAVSVGGLNDVISHSTGSNANLDWRPYSGNFLATGSSTTLAFTNLSGGSNAGVFLDAVSVSAAVPEPATWAMLLIGFGFIGGAMRSAKRRQRVTVSYA